jgi:hypothetical protein
MKKAYESYFLHFRDADIVEQKIKEDLENIANDINQQKKSRDAASKFLKKLDV